MIIFALIVLGLTLGSFVNALAWRLHESYSVKRKADSVKRLSIFYGRSMCPDCRHKLAAKDLMPVFSWLWLRGKCRYCHKPISLQYPLVELMAAGLFVFSYIYWPLTLRGAGLLQFIIWLAFISGFLAMVVTDLRWFWLPDKIIYPLIALAVAQLIAVSVWDKAPGQLLGALWGVLILAGGFYFLFMVSKGQWIGGGDVKLGALLGLIVGGPLMSLLLLLVASSAGTLTTLPFIATGKAKANARIPFCPFLMVATIVVRLFGAQIVHWYKNRYI